MLKKWGQPCDRLCLDTRAQVRVSRVWVFRVRDFNANLVFGARHRLSQSSWLKPSINSGDLIVGRRQSKAGLWPDRAWTPGGKLRFLGLGFLGITTSHTKQRTRNKKPKRKAQNSKLYTTKHNVKCRLS